MDASKQSGDYPTIASGGWYTRVTIPEPYRKSGSVVPGLESWGRSGHAIRAEIHRLVQEIFFGAESDSEK